MNSSNVAHRSPYDVIDDDTLSLFDTVINCVLINAVALFGVAGNALNVIVLYAQGLGSSSTNVVLMSLSAVDLVYDVVMPVRRARCLVGKFDGVAAQNLDALVNVYVVLPTRMVSFVSSGHIVLISIERTICVFFPLAVSRVFTVRRTSAFLAFIYLFWIILFGPFYSMFSYTWCYSPMTNRTVAVLTFSDYLLSNFDALNIVNLFVLGIIRAPTSFLLISAASIATGYKLKQATRKRSKMTSSSKDATKFDVKAVRMLLVVCVVYLGLALPTMVPTLMYFIDGTFVADQGRTTNVYTLSEFCVDFLYVTNSSLNFVIYVTMSSKFARTYSSLFGRYRRRRQLDYSPRKH